jgi:endonuclease YncB( thermonuclease family)
MANLKQTINELITIMRLKKAPLDAPFLTFENMTTTARVVDIIDGDTIVVIFPFKGEFYKFRIRLAGINCPERFTEEGKDATLFLARAIINDSFTYTDKQDIKNALSKNVVIVSLSLHGSEKYGRLLGTIYKNGVDINNMLVEAGHAVPYMLKS